MKKLDVVHFILIACLGILALLWILTPGNKEEVEQLTAEVEFLEAKSKADSLLFLQEYEAAAVQYVLIDSLFEGRLKLDSVLNQIEKIRTGNTQTSTVEIPQIPNLTEPETRSDSLMDIVEPLPQADREERVESLEESALRAVDIKKTGIIEFFTADGVEVDYVGELVNNMANGYGFAIFSGKGLYKGYWFNNKRQGKGEYRWQNGEIYIGDYVNGKREGYGIYYFASGEEYRGEWKNNLRHGQGTLINKNGKTVIEGLWQEDKPEKKKRKKKKN